MIDFDVNTKESTRQIRRRARIRWGIRTIFVLGVGLMIFAMITNGSVAKGG
ncbi:hypothetical protein [Albibacillus kandeliae]|uniref:hypothetical protein n=1 Tax=Albibacillus kandeliae TaxID=2174228 RepID=UPI00130049ED|nr:hypothetical protein [Albibacillus kandeliae]